MSQDGYNDLPKYEKIGNADIFTDRLSGQVIKFDYVLSLNRFRGLPFMIK